MSGQKFFVGANGQNYLNRSDAEIYGGGCSKSVTMGEVKVEKVEAKPEAEVASEQKAIDEKASSFDNLSLDELREIAKGYKISSWAVKGKARLLEELEKINKENV